VQVGYWHTWEQQPLATEEKESFSISPSVNLNSKRELSVTAGILLKVTQIVLLKMRRKKVLAGVPKCIVG